MTYARKTLVSLKDTPYYHVVARCVRRAWLWGVDEYAGRDYSHRKHWVIGRLSQLTRVFAIDVCAYAVMSNHYHLVLHVDAKRGKVWSETEVIERWGEIFGLPPLVKRYVAGQATSRAEQFTVRNLIGLWRARLHDISWFMRAMNEHLARRANAEDECKGRFWEGRFKSQALLDDAGLLTAMVYVDLNPIRAGVSATPESSEFTSIYERIRHVQGRARKPAYSKARYEVPLLSFGAQSKDSRATIPCSFTDYLALIEWTRRAIREDRRGRIDSSLPAILSRLNIDVVAWQSVMQPNGNSMFGRAVGRIDHLRVHAERLRQSWIRGQRQCASLYG
jgi:REP element-mobilizing transposase RayT